MARLDRFHSLDRIGCLYAKRKELGSLVSVVMGIDRPAVDVHCRRLFTIILLEVGHVSPDAVSLDPSKMLSLFPRYIPEQRPLT